MTNLSRSADVTLDVGSLVFLNVTKMGRGSMEDELFRRHYSTLIGSRCNRVPCADVTCAYIHLEDTLVKSALGDGNQSKMNGRAGNTVDDARDARSDAGSSAAFECMIECLYRHAVQSKLLTADQARASASRVKGKCAGSLSVL